MKQKTKCPQCQERQAVYDPTYGILPCEMCTKEAQELPHNSSKEFTSSTIRDQRREYMQSHLQPYYRGQLSREYIEAHGTDKLAVTEKEVKESKYVYKHLPRWHKFKESKK